MLNTNKGNNVELNNSKRACYLHTKRCQRLDPKSGDSHLPFSSFFDVIIVLIFCTPGTHFSKGPVTFRVRRDAIRT